MSTKTIQTLASVSLIGGPLSLIIGGVFLSTAALVCGIIALVMVRSKNGAEAKEMTEAIRQTLMRQAIIGIAMSGIAVVMNAASLIMMMPAILDAAQTGDFSSVFGGSSTGGGSAGSADSGGAFGGNAGDSGSAAPQSGRSSVWG